MFKNKYIHNCYIINLPNESIQNIEIYCNHTLSNVMKNMLFHKWITDNKCFDDPPFLIPIRVLLELEDIRLDISSLPVSSRVSYSLCDGRRLPIRIITISITWPTRTGGVPKPRSLSMQARSTFPFHIRTCI